MNERFFPSAIARRWRVPDGRVSSTRFSTALYAPTASPRSRSGFISAMAPVPDGAQIDGRDREFRAAHECRRHRQRAQSRGEQQRNGARIAAGVAAKADIDLLCARRVHNEAEKSHHRRLHGIRQVGHGTDIAARGSHVLREVVRADREEFGVELVGVNRGRRYLDHDPEARASGGECPPHPMPRPRRRACRARPRARCGCVTIGSMILTSPCIAARASARNCVRKTSGCANESRSPRTPRNGLLSPAGVSPGIGLSPPASSVRMTTGRPCAHSAIRR